jgi:hypothetical protein
MNLIPPPKGEGGRLSAAKAAGWGVHHNFES